MRKNKRLIPLFIVILLILPSVYALDVTESFANGWEFFWGWMQNEYIVYGFTFILFLILMYAISAAALSKVKVFQGDGADGLSRPGKMVAFAIGALSTFGVFAFTQRYGGPAEVLENVLAPFGIFAGLLLALVIFSVVYFGFQSNDGSRSWKLGLGAAAVAMIVAGMVTSSPNIMSIGWTFGLIVGIIALIGAFAKGAGGSSGSGGTSETPGTPGTPEPGTPGSGGNNDGLDYENPGCFRVHVVDEDNNPVRGAKVYVGPEATGVKRLWQFGRKKDVYFGRTGPNGFAPHLADPPATTGSGRIRAHVDAKEASFLMKSLQFWNRGTFTADTSEVLTGSHTKENPLVINIALDIKQQQGEGFMPHVNDVRISQDNQNLELVGEVR